VPSGNTSSAIACLLFCHHKDHNSVWLASPIQYFRLQYLKFTKCFTLFKQLDPLAEISKCLALFNSLLTCPFISSKMKSVKACVHWDICWKEHLVFVSIPGWRWSSFSPQTLDNKTLLSMEKNSKQM
jgi:hypothetical protein